ncbi:MAG: hypothetical protein ACM3ML_34935 [Micromonosporaceae bacterium]
MDGAAGSRETETLPAVLAHLLPEIGGIEVVDWLSSLSGSDFTSVMLEVARRRAARETPASVLRRYQRDRFVRPSSISWWALRWAEELLLSCLPKEVEVVTLAPLVPLGTHSVLGAISQHRVVTAIRACEVAADVTNALALEGATRRARGRDRIVRLAAMQRVVRAQRFDGPGAFAHFSLFGLVTAGRDEGGYRFERNAVAEHVRFAVAGLAAAGFPGIQVALTPVSEAGTRIAAAVTEELSAAAIDIVENRERQNGRVYYRDLCFKVNALVNGNLEEFADGGFTDWGMRLVASNKERMLISGLGIDRLALFRQPQ